MRLSEELMNDVMLFLAKVDELTYSDRKELLVSMLNKNMTLQTSELVLSKYDFDLILSNAKERFCSEAVPTTISKRPLDQREATNLILIESVFSFLNNKNALRRLPKFDRR